MSMRPPLWGNFVGFADVDLLSFAWLFHGGLRKPGYYHGTQAVEKYLKALTLSIVDPDGETETALNNRWIRTHDLADLAARCAARLPYYGQPEMLARLRRFSEFDQVARYPWTAQEHGNGFTSSDVPLLWDLVQHLRTDLPIKIDDYLLGMAVRGYHQARPETGIDPYSRAQLRECVAALRRMFPEVDRIVRW